MHLCSVFSNVFFLVFSFNFPVVETHCNIPCSSSEVINKPPIQISAAQYRSIHGRLCTTVCHFISLIGERYWALPAIQCGFFCCSVITVIFFSKILIHDFERARKKLQKIWASGKITNKNQTNQGFIFFYQIL